MTESYLRGSKAIAKALGVCERTIRRKAQAGELPVIRKGKNTSPLMMDRKDIDRLRPRQAALMTESA